MKYKKKLAGLSILGLLSLALISCGNNNESKATKDTSITETSSTIISSTKDDVNELDTYIYSLIDSTNSYIPSWNQESFKGKWNYIDGVFLNAIINLYKKTSDSKLIDFVYNYVNYYIDSNGNFVNVKNSTLAGYQSGELDTVCESKILFDLYELKNEDRYNVAIDKTYDELLSITRCTNGLNFSHKESYRYQIWLDGMYMYVPFYARYAKKNNNAEIFDEITNQYKYIRNNMFDETKKLYYHGHDTSKTIFWCDSETGNSQSFWLRSMGWYITSLADCIEYFDDGENKEYLKNLLKEALDGILLYQDNSSKMFYQLIDQGDKEFLVKKEYLSGLSNTNYLNNGEYTDTLIKNYLESSGSSMVAYSLMKSARLGYIDQSYYNNGLEIFNGICDHSFKNGKLYDICITAGLGPESRTIRDGSYEYYLAEKVGSDDAKGVGPFIMAYIESKNSN